MEGTWLNTVSSKQGHDFLLLKHDIFCFWVSESWLTLNLSIKFPSDVNFVNAHFSHTKICLHYVMFSSDLLYSAWHFPPPFLFFPSLCWKEKLFLTVPEAFSLSFTRVHGSANPLCRADPPWAPVCPGSSQEELGSQPRAGTPGCPGTIQRMGRE